jgi:hypothetical protein
VTVENVTAAAPVTGCDGVTVQNAGAATPAAVPAPEAGARDARLRGVAARGAVQDALAIVPMIITRIGLWRTERLVPLEGGESFAIVADAREARP